MLLLILGIIIFEENIINFSAFILSNSRTKRVVLNSGIENVQ